METGLNDQQKAFSLISTYLAERWGNRAAVRTTMPLKLTVKKRDGTYRVKTIPDNIDLYLADSYMSKKGNLIMVFEIDIDVVLPKELSDVAYVEIPHHLADSRLDAESHQALIKDILQAANEGVDKSRAYGATLNKSDYNSEELGSW